MRKLFPIIIALFLISIFSVAYAAGEKEEETASYKIGAVFAITGPAS